jgi:hypothetical protein
MPIRLASFLVLREVVAEGGMDHTIAHPGTGSKAIEVGQIAPMCRDTELCQRIGGMIITRQPEHLVPGVKEFANDRRANESRRSRYQYAHADLLSNWC